MRSLQCSQGRQGDCRKRPWSRAPSGVSRSSALSSLTCSLGQRCHGWPQAASLGHRKHRPARLTGQPERLAKRHPGRGASPGTALGINRARGQRDLTLAKLLGRAGLLHCGEDGLQTEPQGLGLGRLGALQLTPAPLFLPPAVALPPEKTDGLASGDEKRMEKSGEPCSGAKKQLKFEVSFLSWC